MVAIGALELVELGIGVVLRRDGAKCPGKIGQSVTPEGVRKAVDCLVAALRGGPGSPASEGSAKPRSRSRKP
jgi:hypothetical protein